LLQLQTPAQPFDWHFLPDQQMASFEEQELPFSCLNLWFKRSSFLNFIEQML